MKIFELLIAGSVVSIVLAADVSAQTNSGLRQPASIQRSGYANDYVSWAPEPAAAPAAKDEAAAPCQSGCAVAACDPTCDAGCDNGCGEKKCRWCTKGSLAEPWTLPQCGAMKDRGIEVHGWLSGGLYSNAWGDESNGPLGFRNLSTGSADQLCIYGERKIDTSKSVFDVGGRIEYMYGMDAPKTQAFGDQSWDYGWNSSRDYGSAIPQAYVEVGWNDLSIKGGHFYTPMGYDVVPAVGRFFYSTSYECYYAEPFTHTGALGTYKMSDKLSASLGWTDGWDGGFANNNGASTVLAGVTWTPGEKLTVAWFINAGKWGNGGFGGSNGDIFLSTFVATYKMSEKLTYVFQNDYGTNYNLGTPNTSWYGINQCLLYKVNDCTSIGGRFEWFKDEDGVRVTGDGLGRVIANPGSYYEFTVGVNYKPHANLLLRPELRYDTFDGQIVNSRPFNRGQSSSQLAGGFDLIFTY